MSSVALQGTKVLEDREIRLARVTVTEGTPPKYSLPEITKYTGDSATPEWKDVEPGRVLFPLVPLKNTQSRIDKFETLCCVKVDISSIPYTSKLGEAGKMGYTRKYNLILLVGLTELKAQVSWMDSETVRGYLVQSTWAHSSHPI